MKKIFLLCSAFLVACNIIIAQEACVAGGGDGSSFEGSVSYSIGVVFYTTEETEEGTITQGVQQVKQDVVTKAEKVESTVVEMNVFPNPIVSIAQFNLSISDFTNVNYRVMNMEGKVLLSEKVYTAQTTFSLEEYPSGVYFLVVTISNHELQKFELIKI